MAPALVFITRCAVQKRMVDGVKVSLQLEPVRERSAKTNSHVHDCDLDDVLIHALVAVLLYPYIARGLAVFDDVLTDLGEGHDKSIDGPVVVVQVGCEDGLSAFSYLSDDGVNIVRFLDRSDLTRM